MVALTSSNSLFVHQDAYAKYNINERNAEFFAGLKLFFKRLTCGLCCSKAHDPTTEELTEMRGEGGVLQGTGDPALLPRATNMSLL